MDRPPHEHDRSLAHNEAGNTFTNEKRECSPIDGGKAANAFQSLLLLLRGHGMRELVALSLSLSLHHGGRESDTGTRTAGTVHTTTHRSRLCLLTERERVSGSLIIMHHLAFVCFFCRCGRTDRSFPSFPFLRAIVAGRSCILGISERWYWDMKWEREKSSRALVVVSMRLLVESELEAKHIGRGMISDFDPMALRFVWQDLSIRMRYQWFFDVYLCHVLCGCYGPRGLCT